VSEDAAADTEAERRVSSLLAGRRVLITGAGSGIGRACAQVAAREGAAVAILDLREDSVTGTVESLPDTDASVIGVRCDVADEASVSGAVEQAVAALGALDCIVAAAGVTKPAHTHELSLAEWQDILGVTLTGMFLTVKHTAPQLLAQGGGSIVTVGSTASLLAAGRSSAYDASKGGVLQFTRAIAAEYAERGIRVNCVCPGTVATALAQTSRELYGWRDDGLDPPAHSRVRPRSDTLPIRERWPRSSRSCARTGRRS
jgi:NAD(P)-dependent dehydrogenase (short-subunit alcohol dehydrogenase family)